MIACVRTFVRLSLVVSCMVFCGCNTSGVDISKVSGTVTFEGQPVSEGVVCFMSDSGFGATAVLSEDGSYQLGSQHGQGIPNGTYKVTVMPVTEDVAESEARSYKAPKRSDIPTRYQDFATSQLEFAVGAGTQVFDIQMTP